MSGSECGMKCQRQYDGSVMESSMTVARGTGKFH